MVKKFKTFGPQLVFAEQTAGSVVVLTNEQKLSIYKKSQKSGISTDILEEVYRRGYSIWNESFGQTADQFAFDRVNSFIAGGFAADLDNDLMEKRGLWDNIHAKRARIKAGSGEHMRKPGSKGAPTDAALKASQNEEADPCWDNYKQVGMKMKGGKKVPNCVPVKEENIEEKFSDEYLRKGRMFAKLNKDRKKPQLSKEDLRKMAADAVKNTASVQKEEVKLHAGKHFKTAETVEKQSKNPNDPDSRFDGTKSAKNVYQKSTPGQPVTEESGVDAERKTAERAKLLDDLIAKSKEQPVKTSVGQSSERRQFSSAGEVVTNTDSKTGAQTKTTIPNQATVKKQPAMTNTLTTIKRVVREAQEIDEDWSDSKYKNPEGGLTRAGVMAYRREHPGSKLKTAVTTPPSKLKKGSKAANRRKSFCARMGGMKKRLTSAKTANDPDSRINKALRKWNC